MGISQFPAPSSGGLSNDFILDKNNTTNNTFSLGREFDAGGYALTTSDNDTSFDIYLINAAGSSVGYTKGSSIVATEAFDTVVALGLATATTVQFQYRGPSTNASSQGLEAGAGAYLVSLTPSDLPNIDDTTVVAGGNFSTAVQITFESGTVVLSAKNVVVGSSTALVVTRPDNLIQDNSPYSLRAVNPGVTQPTGSTANVLVGTVTAGQDPSFVTTSPILGAGTGVAFSTSILTSDTDGTVTNWAVTAGTLPPGLSLATATGALSGTPTTNGDYYFTVRITDDGGNTNTREYNLPVGPIIAGANSTVVGGTTYVWWTSTGTLTYKNISGTATTNYIAIAGGGGGGNGQIGGQCGGGGGAGGLLFGTATFTGSGSAVVTVGAGGAASTNGNNSLIAGFSTAFAGGAGGDYGSMFGEAGSNGGSGGGGGAGSSFQGGAGGAGTAGQGNNGFGYTGSSYNSGGGGGAGTASTGRNGGNGVNTYSAWASAINIIYNAGYFAGGGAGNDQNTSEERAGGLGGGGATMNAANYPKNGSANSGGGGGGGARQDGNATGGLGGSGLVVVRYT